MYRCTYMYTYIHMYVCICVFVYLYMYIYLFKNIVVIRKSLCSFGASISVKSTKDADHQFQYVCYRVGVLHSTNNSWTLAGCPTIQFNLTLST